MSHISCLQSFRNQTEDDILKSDKGTESRVYTKINSSVQVPVFNTPGLTSPPKPSNKGKGGQEAGVVGKGGQEEGGIGEGRPVKDLEASLPKRKAIHPSTSPPNLLTSPSIGKDLETSLPTRKDLPTSLHPPTTTYNIPNRTFQSIKLDPVYTVTKGTRTRRPWVRW